MPSVGLRSVAFPHSLRAVGLLAGVGVLLGGAMLAADSGWTAGRFHELIAFSGVLSGAVALVAWLPLGRALAMPADRIAGAMMASMLVRFAGTVLAAVLVIRLGRWPAEAAGLVMIIWYVGFTAAEIGMAVRLMTVLGSIRSDSTERVAC